MSDSDSQSPEETAVEEDLDSLVADLRRERDEYLELAQRARADFENYRKRAVREGQEALVRGKTEVGEAVLPALDSLERALEPDRGPAQDPVGPGREAEEPTGSGPAEDPVGPGREAEEPTGSGLAEGLALVHRELVGAL
ncbi:MAG: nucleotide exchange factor GrpE, partial [Solirubrobacterales bacterium]|nr:nucleotide exchange factor GrpE [Solirubrobacterales bacterium]